MKAVVLALVAAAIAPGCAYRGPIPGYAAATTRAVAIPMTVIARDIEAESCIGRSTKEASALADAVATALRSVPGANALIDVRFELIPFGAFRDCLYRVRGTAVRIESR